MYFEFDIFYGLINYSLSKIPAVPSQPSQSPIWETLVYTILAHRYCKALMGKTFVTWYTIVIKQTAFSRWPYAVLHACYHNTRLGMCTARHATRSQQEWWRSWLWCVQSGRPRQLIVFDAAADHWGQVSGCVLKEATFSSVELARTIVLPLKWAHWSPLEESGV